MTGGKVGLDSYSCAAKVHHAMCKELIKLVDRISQIVLSIESAQPRCREGIEALCSLSLALEKAKLIIQHCTESSKLYLAITGDAIKLRCERLQNAFGQSLTQIQSLVPLLLAAQISALVDDLKDVKFIIESSEEEAGRVILGLLRQASNSTETSEFDAFQTAALRLKLTSSKALLIEKRSIQKLLDKVCDTDQAKERILKYLLYLLRKYGKSNGDLQSVNSSAQGEGRDVYTISSQNISACNASINPEVDVGSVVHEVETDLSFQPIPPDEFRCPISLRLIHDPVVIASGQTFERVWIEKWFEDGHVTCPKTQKKLPHLSVIPNSAMKDLISKWSQKHGICIPDPYSQPISAELYTWGTLSSSSIASFGSSLNNVPIRVDDSSLTFDSPDVNCAASQIIIGGLNSVSPQTDSHYNRCQFSFKLSHGMNSSLLSKLSEHPWELQCELLADVRNHLDENEQACDSILCTSLIQSLRTFFKDACDRCDVTAQRIGAQVLRILVTKCRNDVPSFHEDVCHLLVSFLDSEIIEEALAIIEVLSEDQYCKSEVVASGALPSILTIIKSGKRELQVPALKIVCNLSSQTNIGTQIIHLGYVPNLISFLDDRSLAPHCIRTLENLCTTEEGRLAVGEAKYFIASIIALLEIGSHEEQEHAVAVLLSLCCHRFEYCQLVLQGGVVPSLATISINGNSKGRKNALELLRLLMDIGYSDSRRSLPPAESTAEFPPCVSGKCPVEKPSVPKAPGYFKRKIKLFPKLRSLVQY